MPEACWYATTASQPSIISVCCMPDGDTLMRKVTLKALTRNAAILCAQPFCWGKGDVNPSGQAPCGVLPPCQEGLQILCNSIIPCECG